MNITLREVYQTSPEGDRFWRLKECYIRGSTVRHRALTKTQRNILMDYTQIKYLRVPDVLLDTVQEEQARAREAGRSHRGGAGPGGPRGMCPAALSFLESG